MSLELESADRVEVRYSGARLSDSKLCPCPWPRETGGVVYETSDPREVEAAKAAFALAWHWNPDSCDCCGTLTLEFFRDRRLLVSVNFHGLDQARFRGKDWGDVPLSPRGRARLARWLSERGLRISG